MNCAARCPITDIESRPKLAVFVLVASALAASESGGEHHAVVGECGCWNAMGGMGFTERVQDDGTPALSPFVAVRDGRIAAYATTSRSSRPPTPWPRPRTSCAH